MGIGRTRIEMFQTALIDARAIKAVAQSMQCAFGTIFSQYCRMGLHWKTRAKKPERVQQMEKSPIA